MIQRFQTVFLGIVVIISALNFFNPFFEIRGITPPSDIVEQQVIKVYLSSNLLFVSINIVVLLLALTTIFLFKNREMQIKLCRFLLLVISGFLASLFFLADSYIKNQGETIHYCTASYLPILQIVCVVTAMMYIRKDEELVRASDRLR